MALTLPYPTIDQFVPTTVHSSSAHNAPHAGLLSNDVAIALALDALETEVTSLSSAVGLLGFSQTNVSSAAILGSYSSLISLNYTKVSSSSILFVYCPLVIFKTGGGNSSVYLSLYVDAIAYADTEKYVSSFDTTTDAVSLARIFTGHSAVSHSISLYGYNTGALSNATGMQLIVFEFGN